MTAQAGTPFDPVRFGKALDLVLTGTVALLPDGTAEVRSGDTTYVVTDACKPRQHILALPHFW